MITSRGRDGNPLLGFESLQDRHVALAESGHATNCCFDLSASGLGARYISILAWAIGQYFVDESAGGRVRHDKEAQAVYLNRVRFLVLAATLLDDGTSRMGAMGSDYFADEMAALVAGNTVRLPDTGNLAVLGTYFGPASALGLLETRPESSGLPFGLTARGTAMYQERSMALEASGSIQLLRSGGDLDHGTARAAIPAFSLARTAEFVEEAELLRKAFIEPWVPGNALAAKRVAEAYHEWPSRCCKTSPKARSCWRTRLTIATISEILPSTSGPGQYSRQKQSEGKLSLQRLGLSPAQPRRAFL